MHSTPSAILPHTKVIPCLQCYIQIFSPAPHYDDHNIMVNVSPDTVNINAFNISTLVFRIWQHFSSNWTSPHLQKLVNVPEVPLTLLFKHMIDTSEPVHSFTSKDDDKDPSIILKILMHPGPYIGSIGMVFTVCICVYCFKRFWIRPVTPTHQPYSPVSSQHVIVDDDVEVAPIYRCGGTVEEPRRPHKNHQEPWSTH